jgi:hypothetical protein
MLDDPRLEVRWLEAGQAAPADGVWMNNWTFERLLEAADQRGLNAEP